MGLLDFKVMLSLPDWKLILVTNHQVSLQFPTIKYPCTAQPMSIPAMPNGRAQLQSIPAVPNQQVPLQCPTAEYPCSAQPLGILAVPNRKVSLQCPTAKYPCGAHLQSIPAVPNILAAHLQCCKEELRGGGKRYTSCAITALGCGCSK